MIACEEQAQRMGTALDLPAGYWDGLARTVAAAVDAGRIGTPKALRLTVHVRAADPADAVDARAQTAAAARRCAAAWFGGDAGSEYTAEDSGVGEANRPVASLLRWPGGQSALLAISSGRGATAGNLVLMGSHGCIYHRIEPSAVPQPQQAR